MALDERTKETLDNCLHIISQNLNNNPTSSEIMDLCAPFFGTSDVERGNLTDFVEGISLNSEKVRGQIYFSRDRALIVRAASRSWNTQKFGWRSGFWAYLRYNWHLVFQEALDMELKCVSGLFAAGSVGMMVMGSGFGTVPGLLGFAVFAYLGYTETDKVL